MLAGDLDLALAQADQVLSEADRVPPADAVRAGTVAAAVLARRGMLARSAELYRWMGGAMGPGMGSAAVLAVPALIGTGALDEARDVLRGPAPVPGAPPRPPTLLAGAEELMAQGVYDSVAGSPTAALSKLTRAASLLESSHRAALLPDTPAALAALVAVHCGELDVAQSVLERAVRVRLGGRGGRRPTPVAAGLDRAVPRRHVRRPVGAGCGLTATGPAGAARRVPRRRARGGAGPAHRRPRDARCRRGAARGRRSSATPSTCTCCSSWASSRWPPRGCGSRAGCEPHLDEAAALLARLGDPAVWAAPLHWSGLQAAIVSESRDAAQRHATALEAAAGGSRYAAAMATAAPHWVRMLDAEVDAVAVEAAARGLHAVGMAWEGGKLAGQAAIRTRDRKAMTALLGCARALQSSGPATRPAVPVSVADVATPPDGIPVMHVQPAGAVEASGEDGPLSDREREVAALVLEGLTYKQIGEQLFISAKTVEHHVARMRQRLGSGSRGELFAHLRQIVGRTPEA